MAGAFGVRSRAPDHRARRVGHERDPGARHEALDLLVRSVRRHSDLCRRYRQLLRAPTRVQPSARYHAARWRCAVDFAAVAAVGSGLPLRAAKLGPFADGTEDAGRLGDRAAVPLGAGRRRRFRFRGRRHAIPGAAESGEARGTRAFRHAGGSRAGGQQRQCRRRLLFAGRAVLLRAGLGSHQDPQGHPQHRAGDPQRHAGADQGCRRRENRHCAASGRVRLRGSERCRGGRDP